MASFDWSSRRLFLQSLASLSAAAVLPADGSAHSRGPAGPAVAYVGGREHLQAFRMGHTRWHLAQSLPTRRAAFLAVHPNRRFLFAVNDVDQHSDLPAGAVESYSIDPASGQLTLLNRRTLSLSATRPRHLAITPEGGHLIVAAYGGGAYNVLPVSRSGELGAVSQILKQMGCGPHPVKQTTAHPHSLAVHPAGKFIFATDLGSDRMNVFTSAAGQLTRISQLQFPPGYGPSRLVIHPAGSLLFVQSELHGLLSCYRFEAAPCQLRPLASRTLSQGTPLAIHPSGRVLFATDDRSPGVLTAWQIDEQSGLLASIGSVETGRVHSLVLSRDGRSLYLLRATPDAAAVHIPLDTAGRPGRAVTLASLESPLSLALLRCGQ